MRWVERSTDVHGGDDGEHERLDERHEDLEGGECYETTEGQRLKNEHPTGGYGDRQHGEGHEKNVTSELVGEETDGVAERAKNKGREQLDAAHDWLEQEWHIRRPRNVFDVGKAVVLEANRYEHGPCDKGYDDWSAHASVGWHLEERDDLGDVPEEDKQEERDEQWQVGQTIWTNRRQHDLLLDKLNDRLGHGANARWNEALLLSSQHEHDRRDDYREHMRQCDLVKADSIDDWLPLDQVGQ